jgi:hypothetical protein
MQLRLRPVAKESVDTALDEFGQTPVALESFKVDPGYVAGERHPRAGRSTAGAQKPTDTPPRPFEAGVRCRPTLVINVETLS